MYILVRYYAAYTKSFSDYAREAQSVFLMILLFFPVREAQTKTFVIAQVSLSGNVLFSPALKFEHVSIIFNEESKIH